MGSYNDREPPAWTPDPEYHAPVGTQIKLQNRHGLTTFEKQLDKSWEPVAFDKTRGTKFRKSLDKTTERG